MPARVGRSRRTFCLRLGLGVPADWAGLDWRVGQGVRAAPVNADNNLSRGRLRGDTPQPVVLGAAGWVAKGFVGGQDVLESCVGGRVGPVLVGGADVWVVLA